MSTLLKFYWAEDVRRIRVAELTYDQASRGIACGDSQGEDGLLVGT